MAFSVFNTGSGSASTSLSAFLQDETVKKIIRAKAAAMLLIRRIQIYLELQDTNNIRDLIGLPLAPGSLKKVKPVFMEDVIKIISCITPLFKYRNKFLKI